MQETNLYDLLKYYARKWFLLIVALMIGAAAGLAYTLYIQVPLYKSNATMLVVGGSAAKDTTLNNNYTELFKSRLVLQTIMDKQGYKGDYNQLLARTTATNEKDTDIIKVSIADSDPQKSKSLLDASLDTFKKETGGLYDTNNIETVDPASTPGKPYNVNLILQTGLAAAATFFLVVIILFFIYDYKTSNAAPQPKKRGPKRKKIEQTYPPLGHRILNTLFGVDPNAAPLAVKKTAFKKPAIKKASAKTAKTKE